MKQLQGDSRRGLPARGGSAQPGPALGRKPAGQLRAEGQLQWEGCWGQMGAWQLLQGPPVLEKPLEAASACQ